MADNAFRVIHKVKNCKYGISHRSTAVHSVISMAGRLSSDPSSFIWLPWSRLSLNKHHWIHSSRSKKLYLFGEWNWQTSSGITVVFLWLWQDVQVSISTHRWAVLTVFCIGFCHTGPISLCVDLFAFICVYFVCLCFILHSCWIIVSTVGWTWWDRSLILRTYLPSVLWHCWLGHLTHKNPSPIWPICLVGR